MCSHPLSLCFKLPLFFFTPKDHGKSFSVRKGRVAYKGLTLPERTLIHKLWTEHQKQLSKGSARCILCSQRVGEARVCIAFPQRVRSRLCHTA